jgi:hypothetical protein
MQQRAENGINATEGERNAVGIAPNKWTAHFSAHEFNPADFGIHAAPHLICLLV